VKRLALALGLGVWLLLAVVVWRDDDLAARAEVEQAPLSDNGYQIDSSGRYVAVGVLVYDKQTGEVIPIYHGSYGPALPTPSSTPGTVPSATPPATNTPRPSATPGNPTPTPDTEPQPTPEGDAEKTCLLRTRNVRINERTEPRVSAPRTATSPIDTYSTIKIYEVVEADGYLWARNVYGWFVIRQGGDWWVDTIEATVGCEDVPGWPQDLAPPPPIARNPRGLHLIFSANKDVVGGALPTLGTLKATDGAEWALSMAKDYDPRITTVYRAIYTSWGRLDCPPDWGAGDPVVAADRWYDMLLDVWTSRGTREYTDYYEYRNECLFVGDWEIAFDRRMVERASASGVCLLLFSDGPGNPEVYQFAQRRPVLDAVLDHPCDRDRLHAVALHNYYGRESGDWLFGRWQMFRAALGPKYDSILYWFTEQGMPDQTGKVDGRGTADCAAARAEMAAVDAVYRAAPEVGGYHVYSVGHSTEWMDLTPCLVRSISS